MAESKDYFFKYFVFLADASYFLAEMLSLRDGIDRGYDLWKEHNVAEANFKINRKLAANIRLNYLTGKSFEELNNEIENMYSELSGRFIDFLERNIALIDSVSDKIPDPFPAMELQRSKIHFLRTKFMDYYRNWELGVTD